MNDTIAAIATAKGQGGVGIIRVSGPLAFKVGQKICDLMVDNIEPRMAMRCDFYDTLDFSIIDNGLVIFFKAPHSFTGEDVVELHGHGGIVVQDLILQSVLNLDVRLARAGEFSERAFINNKLDLAQAEAIASLISASSKESARASVRSLTGEFSKKINALVEDVINLRLYVEAAIDFPEEEIDFLQDEIIYSSLHKLIENLEIILANSTQGALLAEGADIVIVGAPNVGKSTLLNLFAQDDVAIVSEHEGTTRDMIKQKINLQGLVLNIIDTAGIRVTDNQVEQIGIARAKQAMQHADVILLMVDKNTLAIINDLSVDLNAPNVLLVVNKIDKFDAGNDDELEKFLQAEHIKISAKYNLGIEALIQAIHEAVGFNKIDSNVFIARRRHIDALGRALAAINLGFEHLQKTRAGELLAEELLVAQNSLNEITGEFSADDLLGKIFSQFCIGK